MLNQKNKIKQKLKRITQEAAVTIMISHPRLFSIAIGFAIALAVSTAIEITAIPRAHALILNGNQIGIFMTGSNNRICHICR